MGTGYDKDEVQIWINQIEDALDSDRDRTLEEQEAYDAVERHYDKAVEMVGEQGLSEEACYEVEVAYNLMDHLGYELQVRNEPRGDEDWREYYRENLGDE